METVEPTTIPSSPVEDHKRKLDDLEAQDSHIQLGSSEKSDSVENAQSDENGVDSDYEVSVAKRPRLEETVTDGSVAGENGFHLGAESKALVKACDGALVQVVPNVSESTEKSSEEIPEISKPEESPAPNLVGGDTEKQLILSTTSAKDNMSHLEEGSEIVTEVKVEEKAEATELGIFPNDKSCTGIIEKAITEVPSSFVVAARDTQELSTESKKDRELIFDVHIAEQEHVKLVNSIGPHATSSEEEDCKKPSMVIMDKAKHTHTDSGSGEAHGNLLPQYTDLTEDATEQQTPLSEFYTTSRKVEVPNDKVGVLIGKAGDTIRYLQYNSGARIQIARDLEADPSRTTRPVELIGSLESVIKAEKLIKDVIAEAEAGGSPSLIARGFTSTQPTGTIEQIQMQVPNEKVGMIIGKGGENIKNMQTRSGARIQLLPQLFHDTDPSKERTIRLTGDKKQLEIAKDLIKDVMSQPVRSSHSSGGYSQQGYRPRGPVGPAQWGPRGDHSGQYDYPHRCPYTSQSLSYPSGGYGNYPPHNMTSRSGFGSGWDQRAPTSTPHGGGYGYYGGSGGSHYPEQSHPTHYQSHVSNAASSTQSTYYRQQSGAEYTQPAPYLQAPPTYGQGYEDPRYDHQHPQQHHQYAAPSTQQGYTQGNVNQGYPPQAQYGGPTPYAMLQQQPQGPPNSYAPPRATQAVDAYQGAYQATQQPYATSFPQQQTYAYPSGGPMQQTYTTYATDGYSQPLPVAVAGQQPYLQQQQVPSQGVYASAVQPGYMQGGYVQYSSAAPVYSDQQAVSNPAAYPYQAPATDPASYNTNSGAAYPAAQPAATPQGYAQPVQTQMAYDQSAAQSGGYGVQTTAPAAATAVAPATIGKTLSPQSQAQLQPQQGYTQYDSSQMYAAQR